MYLLDAYIESHFECQKKPMIKDVLAVVAGNEITEADLDAFLENVPQEQKAYASHPQFRAQYLEQLITIYAFAALGEEMKLEETDEYKKIVESAKRDILAQMAMAEAVKDIEVTDEEAKTFYEANPQQFEKGATVVAKHILTADEDTCNVILAAINAGEKTFEDAAKESSACPSGAQGGDLGEFGKGQMVKEFEEAAFAAETGQVTGPVKTQFGYHLIKVEKKNEASVQAFEEVKDSLKQNLMNRKRNEAYTARVKELKEKYVQK